MAVDPIASSAVTRLGPVANAGRAAGGDTTADPAAGFAESLAGVLAGVDQSAGKANDAVANMVQGTGDVHEAMLALQRAETAMQLTVQVRNKLVQAYQDVMRMPI
jgi:flagellar hook-basal body complex protein FliE